MWGPSVAVSPEVTIQTGAVLLSQGHKKKHVICFCSQLVNSSFSLPQFINSLWTLKGFWVVVKRQLTYQVLPPHFYSFWKTFYSSVITVKTNCFVAYLNNTRPSRKSSCICQEDQRVGHSCRSIFQGQHFQPQNRRSVSAVWSLKQLLTWWECYLAI